jgi:hypothetical protein
MTSSSPRPPYKAGLCFTLIIQLNENRGKKKKKKTLSELLYLKVAEGVRHIVRAPETINQQ